MRTCGLGCDLVHVGQRSAGKLELPARLQAHIRLAALKADQGFAFENPGPAIGLEPFHQGQDSRRPLVGNRGVICDPKDEFLVFSADLPVRRRGLPRLQPFDDI